jgi:hypothetical protein
MQAHAIYPSRAARRRAQRNGVKSKFSALERQALAEYFELPQKGIDADQLSDAELIKIRDLRAAAVRESERVRREAELAYRAQQAANDFTFSNPVNFPRIAMVFGPVDHVLLELETNGHIDADTSGMPLLFSQNEGIWYPIVPALVSMCDTYTKLAGAHGWTDETDGMRKFAKRLELSMPIFQQDVDRARQTVDWMKRQTLTITPNQFSSEMQEIQIRDEARALGLSAS